MFRATEVKNVPVTRMTCPDKSGIWSTLNLDLGGKACRRVDQKLGSFDDALPILDS